MVKRKFSTEDRRQHPRANEEVPVMYQKPEGKEIKNSTTRDISVGGIAFETEIFVPPATTMEIQINKPINGGMKATLPIHVSAKVIWIKQADTGKYKLGLEFLGMEERYREEITKNVEEQLKNGGEV